MSKQSKQSKQSKSVTLTLYDNVKMKTNLSREEMDCISNEGLQMMNEMLNEGFPVSIICDLVEKSLSKSHEIEMKVIKAKMDEEIKAENFHKEIIDQGNKFIYHKFVLVDDKKVSIETRVFKSERQRSEWLRITKKIIN